jgi:hypothetical protein
MVLPFGSLSYKQNIGKFSVVDRRKGQVDSFTNFCGTVT